MFSYTTLFAVRTSQLISFCPNDLSGVTILFVFIIGRFKFSYDISSDMLLLILVPDK